MKPLIVTVTITRGDQTVIVLHGDAGATIKWHSAPGGELVDPEFLLEGFEYKAKIKRR